MGKIYPFCAFHWLKSSYAFLLLEMQNFSHFPSLQDNSTFSTSTTLKKRIKNGIQSQIWQLWLPIEFSHSFLVRKESCSRQKCHFYTGISVAITWKRCFCFEIHPRRSFVPPSLINSQDEATFQPFSWTFKGLLHSRRLPPTSQR